MEIRVGKYIMRSDAYCMWIEKEYKSKKTGKKDARRVAGYCITWPALKRDFCQRRFRDNDAESVEELLEVLSQTAKDIEALEKEAIANDFEQIRKVRKERKIK